MRITRRQLRRLIKEATGEGGDDQLSLFMKYAEETRDELTEILKMYGDFIDKASDDEEGMKRYSIDAPRDFLRGRLEDLVARVSKLPWA